MCGLEARTGYEFGMWRRLRRRSFAPSRPALYPDQIGLVVFIVAAVGVGLWFALRAAFG
jgi:hypothetical protein